MSAHRRRGRIAIVGVAGRFPGAASPAALWDAVAAGRELVQDYTPADLARAGVPDATIADDSYVRRGSSLPRPEWFDAAFFGYTPREVIRTDPQQRLFLELCSEALERAGYGRGTFGGDIGVYAGARASSWAPLIAALPQDEPADHHAVLNGNMPDGLAARVAYKLGCTGPALTIQTFCSTSLVATHVACQQLRDGECDMALAGGVAIRFPAQVGYRWRRGDTLSRTGRCRAFDARADGLVFGDGGAVVALRREQDALDDGDPILAVIAGSAINNEGAERAGFAAPGVMGQARAVREAILQAGVDPREIGLVEAHGAGTPLGDSVELSGLTRGFGVRSAGFCALGSVKTNIGHVDAAAGVAGLLKVVSALQHHELPRSLHFESPHPDLDLAGSPFFVCIEQQPWVPRGGRRIAGVSSLGIGGTNAHVLVEEAPARASAPSLARLHVLPLSARSEAALDALAKQLRAFLIAHPEVTLPDVAFTLQRGRAAQAQRRVVLAAHAAEAIGALGAAPPAREGHEGHELEAELARRWAAGQAVDWSPLYRGERRQRVALPTSPFERQRFAPEPVAAERNRVLIAGEVMTHASNGALPPAVSSRAAQVPAEPAAEAPADAALSAVLETIAAVLQVAPADLDPHRSLLEMGADSLLLLGVLEPIEQRFGVALSLRQFFTELPTVDAIARHVARTATTSEAPAVVAPGAAAPATAVVIAALAAAPPPASASLPAASRPLIEEVVREQLRLMQRQLQLLGGGAGAPLDTSAHDAPPAAPPPGSSATPLTTAAPPRPRTPGQREQAQPIEDDARRRYLERFIPQYERKTRQSKAYAARFRDRIADSRSTIGFRASIKELLYPIVGDEGDGARIRDIDGNAYVDMTMGYGVHILGHRPPRIVQAIQAHHTRGFALGLRNELSLEVAEGITALTGMDRVAFVATGSEAVMTAMRVARANRRRDGIVIFSSSYHGHADGVLATTTIQDGVARSRPLVVGVPAGAVATTYAFELGSKAALQFIASHADQLAAVMLEPVPTRQPGLQDAGYLRRLRQVTREAGVLLIFDEIVTGFRCHPAGIQGLFGIDADITTYGKVIGGGIPLGVVAGRPGMLDAIDGGGWRFGDDSHPTAESTFFGGTFFQHPLAMTAARAVLDEIRARGPQLQATMGQRAAAFAAELNSWFAAEGVAIEVQAFSSFFRFVHRDNFDLLYFNLLLRGVYIWEWRCWFLSAAHTEADLAFVRDAVQDSIRDLRAHGLIQERDPAPASERRAPPARDPSPAPPTIRPDPHQIPASLAQQQIWALARSNVDGSLAYLLFTGLELRPACDVEALRSALDATVARHPSLRARPSESGEHLLVTPAVPCDFEVVSCATEDALRAFLDQEVTCPFDLQRPSLFRARLARCADRDVLVLAVHHLVADGWSTRAIVEDLAALYTASVERSAPALPPPGSVLGLNTWVIDARHRPERARDRAWWETRIQDAHPPLALPGGRHSGRFAARRRSVELSGPALARLKQGARDAGITLFMASVAATALLLHRLSGQAVLDIGAPRVRRPSGEDGRAVGYGTDLLVMRSQLDAHTSLPDYLRHIRDTVLASFEHDTFTFADVIAHHPTRAAGLVNAAVTLERVPAPPRLGELDVRHLPPLPIRYGPFMVDLNVFECPSTLRFDFDIQEDALDAGLADRVGAYVLRLLDAIARGDRGPAARLPMTSEAERATLLAWGRGPRREPGPGSLIERIVARARATPERPAVSCEHRVLSYRDLDQQSARIATALVKLGAAGRDVVVALCLARSERYVAAVLGVWRAGAAYVPLDLTHPVERHAEVVVDSGAVAIIAEDAAPPALADLRAARWLRLEALLDTPADDDAAGPPPIADDALAYLMYSSGSTGKPKGIQLEAAGLLNHVLAKTEDFGLDGQSVLAQNAPSGFDISVWQMVAPLLWGGQVRVYPEQVVRDPAAFVRALDDDGVTVLELVPSYLSLLLDELEQAPRPPSLSQLRAVILQAEPLRPALVERWYARYPAIAMANAYGATETSDDVLHHVLPEAPTTAITPTGKPIRNARIYILDPWDNLAPVGVIGELCVGGITVGRGYVGITADERFSARDPISPSEPGRFYRTGDRSSYRADGLIDIHGRSDGQLKVRGQRVELGEIERTLQGLPGVREAVVRAFPDLAEGHLLCAYVVLAGGAVGDALAPALARVLPDYMIPRHFVTLDRLPLNANDKVDRAALPPPGAPATAPRGGRPRAHDTHVARIVGELLGLADVDLDAGFFQQGGTSIAAVRLAQRIRVELGVELSVQRLYELPTLRAIGDALGEATGDVASRIPRAPTRERHPVSASAERMYFLWTLEPESPIYNNPIIYEVAGALDLPRLQRALAEVVRTHDVFRTAFEVHGDRVVQRILPHAGPARLEVLPETDDSAEAIMQRWMTPHDLAHPPLIRGAWAPRPGGSGGLLVFDIHHIVFDEGSAHLLLAALAEAYATGTLRPPALCYRDFAEWEQAFRATPRYRQQLEFWREALRAPPPPLDFPPGPRPPVWSFSGARHVALLGDDTTRALRAYCRDRDASQFMVLLAAFKLLLGRLSNRRDLVVGSPVDGRYHPDCEHIIGMFGNSLPLRSHLDPAASFDDYVRQVRSVVLAALDHQAVPLEDLVHRLQIPRDQSRNPLFDFMFVFTDMDRYALELGSAQARFQAINLGVAKMDLTLAVYEREGDTELGFEYATALFTPDAIEALARQYRFIVAQVLAAPERALGEVRVLLPEDEAVLLRINQAPPRVRRDTSISGVFAAVAAEHTGRTALVSEGVRWTYRDLAGRVDRLAAVLRQDGGVAGRVVGVYTRRPEEYAVSILAVLSAGGAFLPLDATAPAARLLHIAELAALDTVVIGSGVAPIAGWRGSSVAVDAAPRGGGAPDSAVRADDPAYVLFTSGSTGEPRGVKLDHAAVLRVAHAPRNLDLGPDQVVLQGASEVFDLAVFDVFAALLGGGTVVMPPHDDLLDPERLARWITAERVTIAGFPTTLFHTLVTTAPAALDGVRLFVVGGEVLRPEVARLALQRYGAGCVLNIYGPVETGIFATAHRLETLPEDAAAVPIGRPVDDTRVYLLDASQKLLPIGQVGEVYIAGPGVGRGYLGAPEATRERFGFDPWAPGERMYRTGDFARWTADGTLMFVGRTDDEVKVRGFRVSPRETERVLAALPGAREAVVVPVSADTGVELAAFVVVEEGTRLPALRGQLAERLPSYLVPTRWTRLPALPRGRTGKIDRRALARGEIAAPPAPDPAPSPSPPDAHRLRDLWMSMMPTATGDPDEEFFAAGGHSLLAVVMRARIQDTFGVTLALREILASPTLRTLSERISREDRRVPGAVRVDDRDPAVEILL